MDIIYANPGNAGGWAPITSMARLAASCFDAQLFENVEPAAPVARIRQLAHLLPRTRGGDDCLLICQTPAQLNALFSVEGWRRRYSRVFAWVVDSFWPEWIPRHARWTSHFDHVFVCGLEDCDTWRERIRAPVSWLPWGTDALAVESCDARREVDLFRLGRQPPAWDDDAVVADACRRMGLRFQGRIPLLDDAARNQQSVSAMLQRSKFVVCFTNRVSPAHYTHPTREYLTGRWVDACGAGAVSVGMSPKGSRSAVELLKPEAMIEFDTTDLATGLAIVKDAVEQRWSSDWAVANHKLALQTMDWRWRFKVIAEMLSIAPASLSSQLQVLERRIGSLP